MTFGGKVCLFRLQIGSKIDLLCKICIFSENMQKNQNFQKIKKKSCSFKNETKIIQLFYCDMKLSFVTIQLRIQDFPMTLCHSIVINDPQQRNPAQTCNFYCYPILKILFIFTKILFCYNNTLKNNVKEKLNNLKLYSKEVKKN